MQVKSIILSTAAILSVVSAYPASYGGASTSSLYRRHAILKCNNYNNQLMCDTTHECHHIGERPVHKPGSYGGNEAWCTDGRRCKCI